MNKEDILIELDNIKTYHCNSISNDQYTAIDEAIKYIKAWKKVVEEIKKKGFDYTFEMGEYIGEERETHNIIRTDVVLDIINKYLSEVEE